MLVVRASARPRPRAEARTTNSEAPDHVCQNACPGSCSSSPVCVKSPGRSASRPRRLHPPRAHARHPRRPHHQRRPARTRGPQPAHWHRVCRVDWHWRGRHRARWHPLVWRARHRRPARLPGPHPQRHHRPQARRVRREATCGLTSLPQTVFSQESASSEPNWW